MFHVTADSVDGNVNVDNDINVFKRRRLALLPVYRTDLHFYKEFFKYRLFLQRNCIASIGIRSVKTIRYNTWYILPKFNFKSNEVGREMIVFSILLRKAEDFNCFPYVQHMSGIYFIFCGRAGWCRNKLVRHCIIHVLYSTTVCDNLYL